MVAYTIFIFFCLYYFVAAFYSDKKKGWLVMKSEKSTLIKIFVVVIVVICGFFIAKKYMTKPVPEPQVLSEKTEEVTKSEMMQNIEEIENSDIEISAIKNDDLKLASDDHVIVLKQVEIQLDDLTLQVGAYFDVNTETNFVDKTLFAWSGPTEANADYTSFHLTDLVSEYPTTDITIRARGTYHDYVGNFDLYYSSNQE